MLFISRFSSFYIESQWCIRYTQCIFSHTKHTRTLISLDFDILVDCLVLFWFGDNPLTFSIRFSFLGVVSLCYQKPHNFSVCSFYSREILNAVIYFIRQKKIEHKCIQLFCIYRIQGQKPNKRIFFVYMFHCLIFGWIFFCWFPLIFRSVFVSI